ncbi:MAG TPA: aldo/keto reductase [Terriglobales bacterium]|nr:aldo/keto reductase [Terriglobales bacterium]
MIYRRFGRTGWKVSEIAYGLWGMSGWTGSDDAESRQSIQASVDMGCNFFDTAWAYGDGKSDTLLGEAIRNNPGRRLYAASKIPPKNLQWPASPKDSLQDVFPNEHVLEYANKIRKALGVERIDLLQYHVWDDSWIEDPDFRKTVEQLKREGLIEFFGLSLNRWEPWNGIRAIETGLVDAVQVIYNIFDQNPEDELFPACRKHDIAVISRVPLDEGSLGGKLTKDTKFPKGDWRSRYFRASNLTPTLKRVEKLKAIVPPGVTLPQMALRFILENPDVSTTIIGMRKLDHVRENFAISDGQRLPPDLVQQLRKHRWVRKPSYQSD